mmetsp:Transcript_43640/g.79575  ORF Transcript_43640/g.79575 Transcript_43640/m.79575 type:complete len:144 (+) Transcript_43640:148-579(+)
MLAPSASGASCTPWDTTLAVFTALAMPGRTGVRHGAHTNGLPYPDMVHGVLPPALPPSGNDLEVVDSSVTVRGDAPTRRPAGTATSLDTDSPVALVDSEAAWGAGDGALDRRLSSGGWMTGAEHTAAPRATTGATTTGVAIMR